MAVWVGGKTAYLLGAMVLLSGPLAAQAHAKSGGHTSHSASGHGSSGSHEARASGGSHGGGHAAHGGDIRESARGGRHGGGEVHEAMSHGRSLHGGSKHAFFASRHGGKASLRYASAGGSSSYSGGGYGGGISCVPYAREVSGIELTGNAATWWDEADGVYARGSVPESGSVLNFRATSSMHLGHVAVVSNVVSRREIEIDHANWWGPGATKGGISRNISVVDVSPNNDWTAVRVGLGHSGDFGSIYPTYGFIYDRKTGSAPHTSLVTAEAVPVPALNPAPRDLRSRGDKFASGRRSYNEVAEAPAGAHGLDLNVGALTLDAPDRSVR